MSETAEKKMVAFWQLKAECYAKDLARAVADAINAQKEVCAFMCDLDRNRDPLIMTPQEYAEFRGWHCYTPNPKREAAYDPTVRLLEELQEVKQKLGEIVDELKHIG